jgi:hypothetical protein
MATHSTLFFGSNATCGFELNLTVHWCPESTMESLNYRIHVYYLTVILRFRQQAGDDDIDKVGSN